LPGLKVPTSERQGLAILREMPNESFTALLTALERAPNDSVPALPGISPEDAKLVVDAVSSMYQVRVYNDVPLGQFVTDVCESLTERGELKSEDEPTLRERLAKLLDIDALNIAAKAVLLQHEYPYTFCGARVLTDVRPVFGKDVSIAPVALVIAHTLKLEYHGAAGHLNEIYMALDPEDISELRDVLDRAQTKNTSLKTTLAALNIKIIDPQ
jgi:hypothetical protein